MQKVENIDETPAFAKHVLQEVRSINVVSLFNGMGTLRQAFHNLGIKVNNYYSSEIKTYAIKLQQHHFPDVIQVGDIRNWREWDIDWSSIDFIGSGSPCQDLSIAGKRAGLSGDKKTRLVEMHLEKNAGCGIMILDNIVHFPNDFNDTKESSALVEWLIGIKNQYKCHIIVVLHENGSMSGGGKAKGHIGSLLENTCETVIRVEKDTSNSMSSIVSPALTRNREFGKFTIEMGDDWIPHLRRYDETETATDKKDIENFRKQKF